MNMKVLKLQGMKPEISTNITLTYLCLIED
ncbi:hypothetical protein FAM22277_00130 [Lacticaseibacillus paracasei]|nr:hypothetical protein FAM22277_00130 [Lacticaseibacillus paracasei]